MKLVEFHIRPKSTYGSDAELFKADITVKGDQSWDPSISIELTPEQIEPILGIVHGAVVAALDKGAREFREQVIASYSPAIEAAPLQPQIGALAEDKMPF